MLPKRVSDGLSTCIRLLSRSKLHTSPSKATISPSATKLKPVSERVLQISGYCRLIIFLFLDMSLMQFPSPYAMHLSPSSFLSYIQSSREKDSREMVASMGLYHSGKLVFTSFI